MKAIFTSTVLLALSSLLSKILGLIRTNRFADAFGAGVSSDAYFAAFQIPDLMYNLIVYGAISAAFIPLLSEYISKEQKEKAWEFTSNLLNVLLICLFSLSLLVFIFAPWIVSTLYFGFSEDVQQLTVQLMRIMIVCPLFFGISGIASGIQNVYNTFLYYSLAPILYNISIILGIIFLAPTYGVPGVAYGVVLGAFLHMLIQIPVVYKHGFRWKGIVNFSRPDFKEALLLSIPRIFALGISQINLIVEGIIASTLLFGSLTVLRYAQDLQYFPIGIIGFSFAISSFGVMSKLAALGDYSKMLTLVRSNIHKILFLVLPASFGLFVLKTEIVTAILQFGAFSKESSEATAFTLGLLCLNLFALSLTPLLTRTYYALKNTTIPFYIGLGTILINIVCGILLSRSYGVAGLALANVFAYTFQFVFLSGFLSHKFPLSGLYDFRKIALMLLSCSVMGLFLSYLTPYIDVHIWLKLLLLVCIGAASYFVFTWNIDENKALRKKFLPFLFRE